MSGHEPMARADGRHVVRLATIILLALLAGAATGWMLYRGGGEPPPVNGIVYPEPRQLPAFELTATDGSAFTRERLAGHWSFLFFGYTHCPDICPLTMADLKAALAELGDHRTDHPVQVVFISVDPQRDTPERLAEYVGYFGPSFVGATGDGGQLESLAGALGVVFKAYPEKGGDYPVDHSSAVLLVDPQARLAAVLTAPHEPAQLALDFRHVAEWWRPAG